MKEWEGQREREEENRGRRKVRDKRNGFRVTVGRARADRGLKGLDGGASLVWSACSRLSTSLPLPVCLSLARLTDVSIYPFLNGREPPLGARWKGGEDCGTDGPGR